MKDINNNNNQSEEEEEYNQSDDSEEEDNEEGEEEESYAPIKKSPKQRSISKPAPKPTNMLSKSKNTSQVPSSSSQLQKNPFQGAVGGKLRVVTKEDKKRVMFFDYIRWKCNSFTNVYHFLLFLLFVLGER